MQKQSSFTVESALGNEIFQLNLHSGNSLLNRSPGLQKTVNLQKFKPEKELIWGKINDVFTDYIEY